MENFVCVWGFILILCFIKTQLFIHKDFSGIQYSNINPKVTGVTFPPLMSIRFPPSPQPGTLATTEQILNYICLLHWLL